MESRAVLQALDGTLPGQWKSVPSNVGYPEAALGNLPPKKLPDTLESH